MVSVCANGRHANEITKDHALEFCEGRGTPFEKLYDLDGYTLLLGVTSKGLCQGEEGGHSLV